MSSDDGRGGKRGRERASSRLACCRRAGVSRSLSLKTASKACFFLLESTPFLFDAGGELESRAERVRVFWRSIWNRGRERPVELSSRCCCFRSPPHVQHARVCDTGRLLPFRCPSFPLNRGDSQKSERERGRKRAASNHVLASSAPSSSPPPFFPPTLLLLRRSLFEQVGLVISIHPELSSQLFGKLLRSNRLPSLVESSSTFPPSPSSLPPVRPFE